MIRTLDALAAAYLAAGFVHYLQMIRWASIARYSKISTEVELGRIMFAGLVTGAKLRLVMVVALSWPVSCWRSIRRPGHVGPALLQFVIFAAIFCSL